MWAKGQTLAPRVGGLRSLFGVTGGRAPSFHDLSVGEAAAPPQVENVGGGRTPPQVSHRKDQPGRLGIEEKISLASHLDSADIHRNSKTRILIKNECHFKLLCSQNLPNDPQTLVRSLFLTTGKGQQTKSTTGLWLPRMKLHERRSLIPYRPAMGVSFQETKRYLLER